MRANVVLLDRLVERRDDVDGVVEHRDDVRECVAEEAADTDGHVDAGAAEFVQRDQFDAS